MLYGTNSAAEGENPVLTDHHHGYLSITSEEGLRSRRFSQILADRDFHGKMSVDDDCLQLVGTFNTDQRFFLRPHRKSILLC